MNYLLSGLLLFSILCLITVFWQTIHLKRRLDQYTRALEKINTGNLSASNMPVDQPGLEKLSNLVHSLYIKQTDQLAGLQSEIDRLQATLNQITDGVLIVDHPGRISMANPAAISLFGEGDELVGKTVSLALRHHLLIETWRKCQQTNEVTSESVELPGSKIFLQMIAIPDEHAGGALLLIQDLTRIRRLETVRRDFISNVSHELRTPLASLKALAETLQEGALDDPPAAKRFLGRMLTEVDALTQMASELLELSRIESGQVPLDKKTIQPCTLLQQAADRMKMQVERAGLELFVECPADLPPLLADM
ncbi:MAG: histidine kinase dimerization/phospho-acceptor domain-containing protein, partial [Chloroflexota bacterium]